MQDDFGTSAEFKTARIRPAKRSLDVIPKSSFSGSSLVSALLLLLVFATAPFCLPGSVIQCQKNEQATTEIHLPAQSKCPGRWRVVQADGTIKRLEPGVQKIDSSSTLAFESEGGFSDRHLSELAKVPQLTRLDIAYSKVTRAAFANFANGTITELTLSGRADDFWFEDIPKFTALTSLIAGGPVGGVTAAGLSRLRKCSKLASLELRGNGGIDDMGARQISYITSLRYLDLSGSRITDLGLQFLSELPSLESFLLDECLTFEVSDLPHLSEFKKLTYLSLDDSQADVEMIKGITQLPCLKALSLHNCNEITDEFARIWPENKNFESLRLGSTKFTNKGLEQLLVSLSVAELTLWDCNQVTDEVIPAIKQNTKLRKLTLLGKTGISQAAADKLKKDRPELEVFRSE